MDRDSRLPNAEHEGGCADRSLNLSPDPAIAAALRARERQQSAVAWLGQFALAPNDIGVLMDKAVKLVAEALEVEHANVLELLPDGTALLLRAGAGWREGLVGRATVSSGADSQGGFTLHSEEPVIVSDLCTEPRFSGPPLLHEHGVVSGLSVIIGARERPFGILGAHTTRRRIFTQADVNFVQSVANVLAAAVDRVRADEQIRRQLETIEAARTRAEETSLVNSRLANAAIEAQRRVETLYETTKKELEERVAERTAQLEAVVRDLEQQVRERHRAEQQLRLHASALEAAANAIVITDQQGTIKWVNAAFTALTGYTPAEAIGQNPRVLKSGRQSDDFYRLLWETIAVGQVWHDEIINRRKDGSFYIEEMTITPVRDADGTIGNFIAIKQDVTARKQAEKAIQALNEDLRRQAAELEAANRELEAFSYSVSHDLRAPLRAMAGFSRILTEDCASDLSSDAKHYLELIHDNARHMGELIDHLLTFSRLSRQPLARQAVRPAELVRQVLADLAVEQEGRRIEVTIGDLPPCEADPTLLKQVFANLLGNALKFTRRRDVGVIEVGHQGESGEEAYFVKDNGAGFDMRYADKLFGVFQRLHRADDYEGTGVGLAIVQRIVHRHGGRVWAEGAVDRGATFYFTI